MESDRNVISYLKNEDCQMCGKCYMVCEAGAITFSLNASGNYRPVIAENSCIKCGVCHQICYDTSSAKGDYRSKEHYIGYSKDAKERKQSASGGIFPVLARWILQRNGIVFGAAYDADRQEVVHLAIEHQEDLWRLQGSKYVQSNWISVINKIEDLLKEGRLVLFSGTPCQVSSVKWKFGNFKELFLVDLFCHGVSRTGVFFDSLKKHGIAYENIRFRYKRKDDPSNYYMRYQSSDGNFREEVWHKNELCQLFVGSETLKKSCFDCKYAEWAHDADITLGDFDDLTYATSKGILYNYPSVIVANSEKGKNWLKNVQENLVFLKLEEELRYRQYYRRHETLTGPWGYNIPEWEQYNKTYKERGYEIATYETLYPKQMEAISKIEAVKGESEEVWIYGAGACGKALFEAIRRLRPNWKVQGFVVTKRQEESCEGLPIFEIDEMRQEQKEKHLWLVGVSLKYEEEVLEELRKRKIDHIVAGLC